MRKEVVLITGANGEMGHGLISHLSCQDDINIVALDVSPLDDSLKQLCGKFIQGDILDTMLLGRLVAEYEIRTIYHLASILSTKAEYNPETAHKVNVEGTLNLLRLAVEQSQWQGKPVKFWLISIGENKISNDETILTPSETDTQSEKADEIYKIEGTWGDWSGTEEDPRTSIVHIRREKEGFVINGDEYDENYKKVGFWASDVSKFRKQRRRLEYLFEATGSFTGDEVINVHGYTLMTFSGEANRPPETYSGAFVDVLNPKSGELRSGSFEGRRLSDHEVKSYFGEPEHKRIIIDKLILNARDRAKAILYAKPKVMK